MAGTLPTTASDDSPSEAIGNGMEGAALQSCNVNNEEIVNHRNDRVKSRPTSPSKDKSSSKRKKWSVQGQDGPRGLLRRMRSQLAEDGCPESQFVLAKALLEQKEDDSSEESDRLAVFWLIQASLQGNIEATEQLQHCFDNNIGMCEHNYQEVVDCLNMDQQEKLARRAARALFSSLSDGNEFITSSRLSSRVQEILDKHERGELEDDDDVEEEETDSLSSHSQGDRLDPASRLRELYGGERFTEENLVSAAVLYTQGFLPPLQHFIIPYSHHRSTSIPRRILMWPFWTWSKIYEQLIQLLGVDAISHITKIFNDISPLTISIIVCLVVMCWSIAGLGNLIDIAPSFLWCGALTSMILASANIIANLNRLETFRVWSEVFISFCPSLDVNLAEFRFRKLCWKPYVGMWIGLCIYLACLPYIDSSLVIYTYPTMLLCTFITFFSLSERISLWKFFSLITYSIAIIPAAHEAVRDWLLHYSHGSSFDFLLEDGQFTILGFLQLNYGLAPLLHVVWILILIAGSVTKGLSSVLTHLINIIWCHLTVIAARNVDSPSQLMYPAIAWSTLGLMPVASSAISLIGPGVLVSACCLQIGATLWLSALAMFVAVSSVYTLRKLWPEMLNILRVFVISICILYLTQPILQSKNELITPTSLKWDSYKNVCIPSSEATLASVIDGCQGFQGVHVRWQGKVVQVDIKSIKNWPKLLLSYLPPIVQSPLFCMLGSPTSCYRDKLTEKEFQKCLLLKSLFGNEQCSLDDWNVYNFDISISMSTSFWKFGKEIPLVHISASNDFKEFMLGLEIGDDVEFIGTLDGDLGTYNPKISLSSIICTECSRRLLPAEIKQHSYFINIQRPAKYIFNFFFSPLLTV